ncbi:MAG TPA: hypothetical protein VGF99_13565 [Myxococcota bacterium]
MERVLVKSPEEAGTVLEAALKDVGRRAQLTVADAAARSGLSLGDAERGLHWLSTKYRGTLSATDEGELLFRFPYGMSLPLTKQPWLARTWDRVKSAVVGVGKFVVRAWVSVVMVGYALVFLAVGLALLLSGRDERGGGGAILGAVFRVLAEALYWTFHPFSPVARRNVWDGSIYDEQVRRRRRGGQKVIRRFGQEVVVDVDDEEDDSNIPFYEKVNRFVFGPEPEAKPTHEELSKRLVAQIRANQGRIGLLDVMKVTGLPREEADPLLSRLLLDYDGEVDVDEHGGITYRFQHLRKTAGDTTTTAPPPAWSTAKRAPQITGNPSRTNLMVAAVNAFNLAMATVALQMNLTMDRLIHLITHIGDRLPTPPMPYDGVPVVLGVIPWVFSVLLFALPIVRWVRIDGKKKQVAEDNARSAVLKTVFESMQQAASKGEAITGVREDQLSRAWQQAAGTAPTSEQLTAAVAELGGDVDVDAIAEGRGLYRFRDLEAEVEALRAQRAAASKQEEHVGEVVFKAE